MRCILAACILALLFIPSPAPSEESCYNCHNLKAAKCYINKADFEQSVHAGTACTGCHLGIADYPHGKVSKVRCGICHFIGRDNAPREQAVEYKLSVHGTALRTGKAGAPDCQACHGSHYIFPAIDPRSRTNRWKVPELCSTCHAYVYGVYRKSIHGKALFEHRNTEAPTCFDCHMEHRVPSVEEPAWKLALIRECGNCHVREVNTYRRTFHGKVTQLGYANMALCSDCHGSHDILRVTDEGSLLSPKNRLRTCRACHPHATEGFTKFYAHPEELDREKYPALFYTYIFMTTLLIGVFTFFFIHTFLWTYRSLKERIKKREGE